LHNAKYERCRSGPLRLVMFNQPFNSNEELVGVFEYVTGIAPAAKNSLCISIQSHHLGKSGSNIVSSNIDKCSHGHQHHHSRLFHRVSHAHTERRGASSPLELVCFMAGIGSHTRSAASQKPSQSRQDRAQYRCEEVRLYAENGLWGGFPRSGCGTVFVRFSALSLSEDADRQKRG
jgi:hypothetical protein